MMAHKDPRIYDTIGWSMVLSAVPFVAAIVLWIRAAGLVEKPDAETADDTLN